MPPTTIKVVRYYLGQIHGGLCYLGILWYMIYIDLIWTMIPTSIKVVRCHLGKIHGGLCYLGILWYIIMLIYVGL